MSYSKDDLYLLTVNELKDICRKEGISRYGYYNKDGIIRLILNWHIYDPLLEWLSTTFGYYTGGHYRTTDTNKDIYYKNVAPSDKVVLDIVGIKNTGTHDQALTDEIEIIGVNVKKSEESGEEIKYEHIVQAAGYKMFVHKAYLATTANITPEDKYWAQILRIGLIKVERVDNKPNFSIVLEAPYDNPNHAEMLRLLDSLFIGECTICKNYFLLFDFVEDKPFQTYFEIERIKQLNGLVTRKDSEIRELIENPHEIRESEHKILRYICYPCKKLLKIN